MESGDGTRVQIELNQFMNKHQYLDMKCRQFLTVVDECIFPICTSLKRDVLEQVGTGVAIEIDSKPYLLTAKHVVKEIFDAEGEVHIGDASLNQNGKIYSLPSHAKDQWRYHPNNELDIAIIPVTTAIPGLAFFPINRHIVQHDPEAEGDYFLAGYPNTVNTTVKVNPQCEMKRLGVASIIVRVDQSISVGINKRSPAEFLRFNYKTVYENGVRKPQGKSLKGMSGCGLWYFPEDDQGNPCLAGILTEHYKGTHTGYAPYAKFALEIP